MDPLNGILPGRKVYKYIPGNSNDYLSVMKLHWFFFNSYFNCVKMGGTGAI